MRDRVLTKRWLAATIWIPVAAAVALAYKFATTSFFFSTEDPKVSIYVEQSAKRLILGPPPLYMAHPNLIMTPLILFAIALLPLLIPYLRKDRRAQFLWGATLLPLAVVYNPFSAWLLGQV